MVIGNDATASRYWGDCIPVAVHHHTMLEAGVGQNDICVEARSVALVGAGGLVPDEDSPFQRTQLRSNVSGCRETRPIDQNKESSLEAICRRLLFPDAGMQGRRDEESAPLVRDCASLDLLESAREPCRERRGDRRDSNLIEVAERTIGAIRYETCTVLIDSPAVAAEIENQRRCAALFEHAKHTVQSCHESLAAKRAHTQARDARVVEELE